jgi:hypothetical protein
MLIEKQTRVGKRSIREFLHDILRTELKSCRPFLGELLKLSLDVYLS